MTRPAPIPAVRRDRRDDRYRAGHPTPYKRAAAGVVVSVQDDTVTTTVAGVNLTGVIPLGDMPVVGDIVEVEARGSLLVIPGVDAGVFIVPPIKYGTAPDGTYKWARTTVTGKRPNKGTANAGTYLWARTAATGQAGLIQPLGSSLTGTYLWARTTATGTGNRYAAAVAFDSPSRYLRLEETTGTVAAGWAGTPNGSYVATPTLGAVGREGNGVTSTVAGGYIDLPLSGLTTAWSLEFWHKHGGTTNPVIWRDNTGSGGWLWLITTTVLTVRAAGTDRTVAGAGTTLTDGNWHHCVMTSTGTSVVTYIDGVAVDTWARTANASTVNTALKFGRNGTAATYYAATYDEVAVYPFALSAGQVAAHYAAA